MKRVLLAVIAIMMLGLCAAVGAQTGTTLSAIVLPSAARTAATVNTADQTNAQWGRAQVIINVSARTSGTYTPTIQGKDPVSGNYYTILTGAGISSVSTTVLNVGAGFPNTANVSAGTTLPRVWRVQLVGTLTPIMTFSVGAFLNP